MTDQEIRKPQFWAFLALSLMALLVIALGVYGAMMLVNSFFDKNVVDPRGPVQVLRFQKPRLWVDKSTNQKELDQEKLIDQATNDAVDHVLNATPTAKPRSLKFGEVMATDNPVVCKDVVSCIREVGESLGVPNRDIMTMIRIAKAESGYKPTAKNSSSSARGVFQILLGTWESNDCEGSRLNFHDNIVCAYKLYQARGFQPWDSSKSKWLN